MARRTRWLTALVLPLLLAGCPWDEEDESDDGGDNLHYLSLPLGFVGHTFAYSVYLDLGEAFPFTWEPADDAPSWLTLTIDNDGRAMFYGTPTGLYDNRFVVDITDSDGTLNRWGFELEVMAANALPVGGLWDLTVDVTTATGVCEGEEDEPATTHRVSISQVGSDLTLAGLQGEMANVLHGYLYPSLGENSQAHIRLEGSLSEDGGTTSIVYNLDILSYTEMSGTEFWDWEGAAQECSGGSSLTMVRVP